VTTLSDIAREAGVSVSAVSRVLSNAEGTRVSEGTRARIHRVAKDLNYRPNFAARALKFQRTAVLACIVPDLTNAMFSELVRGVESCAREHDYTVLLSRAEVMLELDAALARLLGEGRVDGVIVQTLDATDPAALDALSDAKMPVVFVNTVHPHHAGSVILDDHRGAATATQHLIDLGHQRIGFIGGLAAAGSARRRLEGFADTMASVGLIVDPEWVTAMGYRPADGMAALGSVMDAGVRPTALVIANVNAAMGALLEARRRGWSVPQQLSVAAIHDSWPAENTWPPLTTVKMPFYELGREAVKSVIARISQDDGIDLVVGSPAPELIVRESSAPPLAD
jgi:LacI family transcriptional regulator